MIDRMGKIDYAEGIGNMIIHFSKDGKPVLIEVMDVRVFNRNNESFYGRCGMVHLKVVDRGELHSRECMNK